MRLGDFRKETEKLSDDYILDDVMFIEDLPGYWDGYPNECKNHKRILTNEQKIRFYMYDSRTQFWDYCDKNKSYEENLEIFMSKFERGIHVNDDKWENYLGYMKRKFEEYWNEEEWQNYVKDFKNESK